MATNILQTWFPTTKSPVVMCPPMFMSVNGILAAEVTKAGGLGFVAGAWDFTPGNPTLADLDEQLSVARAILAIPDSDTLPVGVGFLTFDPSVVDFAVTGLPILRKHKPAAIWLFVPQPDSTTHRDIISVIRAASDKSWSPKVFVQVGNVAAAREALEDGADGLVAQGVDAGGHQWAQGSSVISLVPEIKALTREKKYRDRDIAIVAAGGISHGSSVVAALALGADGVGMGTRFLVAEEASSKLSARDAIIQSTDGGASTVKSLLHDHIEDRYIFPGPFDGRALVGPSILDERDGVTLAENQGRLKAAVSAGDTSRDVVWAGTGVGLINEVLPAAEILDRTRAEALESLQLLQAFA
ncbi:2-nitropropane dioxygenase [Microdochium trichocladiopsis]|uniref:2-nitropropane dioxygenase n=1 Tax=Microdochium trichocladiopsis TaxID=1682393 RepID=A0A9P8YKZ6_9PEZI|nr:2-nitropropane dioxygenase [Microdochium trichocladiopsis]KAH7041446.1 2-nitropropane dioxygenase [Microdochium trichocladiopsis]